MEEQQSKETEIRLQDLWALLKHCWWQLVIVLVVVSMLLYIGLSVVHQDEYTATVSIYVMNTPNKGDSGSDFGTAQISMAMYLIKDCLELGKSHDQILRPVMISQNLEGLIEIEDLERMYSISKATDAHVLYLSVTSASAQRSADIVNALATQTCEYFNAVYEQRLLSVVDYAVVPTQPSNPVSILTVLLVAFVCAVLVYGIHFMRFILDDKINTPEDVEKYLNLSTLGVIPNKNDVGRKKSKYGYYYSYTADGEKKRG